MDIDNAELNASTATTQSAADNSTKVATTAYADAAAAARQAQDDVLDDLSALAVVANNEFVVGDGAGSYAHESGATARTSMGVGAADTVVFKDMAVSGGFINYGAVAGLTIASGVVTATQTYHSIDTESATASDDLRTISGGSDGDILIIRAFNSSRSVVVKKYVSGADNIVLDADITLDHTSDRITLQSQTGFWIRLSSATNF